MKKALIKKLTQVAAELPPQYEDRVRGLTGSQAIEWGLTKTTKDGEKVISNGRYRVEEKVLVNHLERIKDAWKQAGEKGVMVYVKKVNDWYLGQLLAQKKKKQAKAEGGLESVEEELKLKKLAEEVHSVHSMNVI